MPDPHDPDRRAPGRLRPLEPADWPAVAAIYASGIATGTATFETAVPAWADWDAGHLARPRLVAVEAGGTRVVGWAALAPVSDRCAYAGVAEVSVSVDPTATGRGVGSALLAGLVAGAEAAGLWTLQAGVFPQNAASLALHRRHGFRVVGTRERLGQLGGEWRDVVLLERRSPVVGR
jgi:L-amino acid N-acyltransferase YncA